MKNFYMTLLSNSSMDLFPDNKTTSFSVQLPKYMYLNGGWEVALAEIQYPYTLTNVDSDQIEIEIETVDINEEFFEWFTKRRKTEAMPNLEKEWSTVQIAAGFYSDIKDIVDAINTSITKVTKQNEFLKFNNKAHRVGCQNNSVQMGHKYITAFKLRPRLALQLGFIPNKDIIVGKFAPNVANSGVIIPDKMVIYCDILEPQIIGDTWGKVLRIVSTDAGISRPFFGQSCNTTFNVLEYIPVQSQNFDTINIDIRDVEGENISFAYGTLTVKLHFRKRT